MDGLLTLNNAPETEISHLEPARFRDGPNFLWFRERGRRVAHVDRVVVAPAARGRGIARNLYGEVLAHSAEDGQERAFCEANLDPPNPASDLFHAARGFAEVGRMMLPSGKVVRYLSRPSCFRESPRSRGKSRRRSVFAPSRPGRRGAEYLLLRAASRPEDTGIQGCDWSGGGDLATKSSGSVASGGRIVRVSR